MSSTHTLPLAGVDLVYDVHGRMPVAGEHSPLVLIGQPMDAGGFASLVPQLADRTVVTYDPRGLGRSVRKDARVHHVPQVQAADVHAVIEALGVAPVELFASSGGAVTALALVTDFPGDVSTVVAHEPPLTGLLPDADAAARAYAAVRAAYAAGGWGAGMAEFIAMTSWQGEFTDEYFTGPRPDPAAFGLPMQDDGSREDPLLSDRSAAMVDYHPDLAALAAAPTRLVVAAGEESAGTLTARTAEALAAALGQQVAVFPSHHAGFAGGEFGQTGRPEAFGRRLREVLGD